ncbi:MAG: glycoside hydrolase family 127 protein [Prevotellaceae bacterium]|nr:glycoside hydrolase family 127 protein [Prevotellaceae bacterium]
MKIFSTLGALLLLASAPMSVQAQTEIYPQHFALSEVKLLSSPMLTAMETNNRLLLEYDADRLLAPFVRQAGLNTGRYANWLAEHPSFPNWGLSDWSLEGHVGGHYLTALALAIAATDDAEMKAKLQERLTYMLDVLNDCQTAYDDNTQGLYGFIGGQPINNVWTGLYSGDTAPFKQKGGWVPFYCQHKVLAGLRDAWLYTGNELARTLFQKLSDWSVNVVNKLTTQQMQDILGAEHGGMNETLADAYRIFGDSKYLDAAKKYSHQHEINGMQTLNTTFLDGQHANTQVPKFIGFERVWQEEHRSGQPGEQTYRTAAHNFWQDVAENRTVCIGGNSVSEHFLAANRASQYIDNLEGPESCNSNNMMKLSENLFDEEHDARYADFYEATLWNHILSTQDPTTGGYVYFTTLRPQAYRIYSQVNQGMWCCVGTGMENHGKYGHFIYTHSEDNETLYVNLFTPSVLKSDNFALTQTTDFPYTPSTKLTIDKAGTYTLAVRHPAWTTAEFDVRVNGESIEPEVQTGVASYVNINRTWSEGDEVEISLPMTLRYETCPNLPDYIAFKYGPILLAAATTAASEEEAATTGLSYEQLQNEYAGEGRMDHSPGSRANALSLSSSPLLIGDRNKVLERIEKTDEPLRFTLKVNKGNWETLSLVPFYTIHHARYSCYFYQQTEEEFANSDMGRADAEAALLESRTLDHVGTGEQQSEAGHEGRYSDDSGKGSYKGEYYRDAKAGGWFEYTLSTAGETDSVSLMLRFTTADHGRRGTIFIDGEKLAEVNVPTNHSMADDNGFYNEEYPVPASMLTNIDGTPKSNIVFRFEATGSTLIPGLYSLRLLHQYGLNNYRFVCTDWTTGDANRVSADKFTYDETANTIRIAAGTGTNNVCLMMRTEGRKYTVRAEQKFLVVKGTNLKKTSGSSFLWWLNGKNTGSSVAPTTATTAADGETIIAWDITKSNIDDYCKGGEWDCAHGQTIFGLTGTTNEALITYIGYIDSIDDFLVAVGIDDATQWYGDENQQTDRYDLSGRKLDDSATARGIVIENGRKQYIDGR